jgi:triosephosphate isomerase
MVAATGAKYVILGHSERREYYGETDALLLEKTKLALKHNLSPIYCIGEKLEERESNIHFDVVKAQIENVVCQLSSDELANVVLAYEPVWAIGTGKTASSEQAQEMHAFIRSVLAAKFGEKANSVAILYGGSCKPSNAQEIFAQPDVDGGLIGGASLVASDFIAIAKSF